MLLGVYSTVKQFSNLLYFLNVIKKKYSRNIRARGSQKWTLQETHGNSILEILRLYKPVSDWLEMLPLDSTGLNMFRVFPNIGHRPK